ncbi:MAG: acylphosphatase [Phaeodactylibacter sp.]|uniref:acylphosphatase n=1 Tax=Phaeodactylibacter sp. TaxID=1940289 RepID=UPI0032EC6C02
MQQVKLRITGKVQGVFFRASTREKAQQLGITGWVKNEPDGSVTAVGQGPEADLQKWINWCHEGPPHARVDAVDTKAQPVSDCQQFEILR